MTFVKVDTGILDSSLWGEAAETRVVFITILAMCRPDGLCAATAPGIAQRARLPLAAVRRALIRLQAPDRDSRSVAEEGRRITRVDGGFYVTNYLRYRSKDHTAADRKRRQRERERGVSRRDTVTVTQGEGEAEGEAEVETETDARAPAWAGQRTGAPLSPSSIENVLAAHRRAFPKHRGGRLTEAGMKAIRRALAVYSEETVVAALAELPHHPELLRRRSDGKVFDDLAGALRFIDRLESLAGDHRKRLEDTAALARRAAVVDAPQGQDVEAAPPAADRSRAGPHAGIDLVRDAARALPTMPAAGKGATNERLAELQRQKQEILADAPDPPREVS